MGVKWAKLYGLEGKLNQIIVYRVIQTLSILEGSELDFFPIFFTKLAPKPIKLACLCHMGKKI